MPRHFLRARWRRNRYRREGDLRGTRVDDRGDEVMVIDAGVSKIAFMTGLGRDGVSGQPLDPSVSEQQAAWLPHVAARLGTSTGKGRTPGDGGQQLTFALADRGAKHEHVGRRLELEFLHGVQA